MPLAVFGVEKPQLHFLLEKNAKIRVNIQVPFFTEQGLKMIENKNDKAAEAAQEPKNIPPANLPEELLPVYDWYMGKGKDQLLVAAIVLVVGIVAFSIFKYRNAQNAEASFALTGAEGVESLEGLNAKYGRTAVAPVISLRLARAYFDAGDYEKAAETFETFAKKNRKHVLAPQGRLGQAVSLEGLASRASGEEVTGYLSKARDIYIELAEDTKSPVYAEAMMGNARCLAMMGDKSAASDILDRLVIDVKDTQWEQKAESLRGVIDRFDGFRAVSFFDQLSAVSDAPKAKAEDAAAAAEEVVPAAAETAPAAETKPEAAPAPEAKPEATPAPEAKPEAAPAPEAKPEAAAEAAKAQ